MIPLQIALKISTCPEDLMRRHNQRHEPHRKWSELPLIIVNYDRVIMQTKDAL